MILDVLVGNTMAKRSKLAQSAFLWVLVLQQKKIELVNTVVVYCVLHGNSQVKNAEETHLFPMFK